MIFVTGYHGLIEHFNLQVPRPFIRSEVGATVREAIKTEHGHLHRYTIQYSRGNSPLGHLDFALRNEPIDLRVLAAAFPSMDPSELTKWIEGAPTSKFGRRAWLLYEWLTELQLPLPNAGPMNYVPLLELDEYVTGPERRSIRHKINNNLLGNRFFCPVVRRTEKISPERTAALQVQAVDIVNCQDSEILARATRYLYTEETRSSFEIEGDRGQTSRHARFLDALANAETFDATQKRDYVALQNLFALAPYRARDWRNIQNFVSRQFKSAPVIEYICPRPEDVSKLMTGLTFFLTETDNDQIDPIVQAAVVAFGFVFIHPFEDGNGRIHRFLLHHLLLKAKFTPTGVVIPVSAAILRRIDEYKRILRGVSAPLQKILSYELDRDGKLNCENNHLDLYFSFDATEIVEFVCDMIENSINIDMIKELKYVDIFDRAFEAAKNAYDIPDARLGLLIRLCLQNGGHLSNKKRRLFAELDDTVIKAIESIIADSGEPPEAED